MIMYIMPLAIGVFMFVGRWPAGLFIYWVTSNLWTIGQQYVINRTMPPPVPAVAPSGGTGGASKERKKPQAKSRKR
jgi:YidC/Oxa1 family membrane protein insertase